MTLKENLRTLQEFSQMKQNWYSPEEGTPISKKVIRKAKKLLRYLGNYQPYIYPTIDGNIQLEFDGMKEHDHIEIVVMDDRIEYFQMLNKDTIDVNNLSLTLVPKYVKLFFKEELT